MQLLDLLSLLVFVPAAVMTTTQQLENKNITCFSSTLLEAQQLQLVFDLKNDDKNLWENTENSSLPACNFSSISSSSSSSPECFPCIDRSIKPETVYIFCQNLRDIKNVRMEASKANRTDPKIDFNDTNCPTAPPSDGPAPPTPTPGDDQSGRSRYPTIICFVFFVIGLICVFIRAAIIKCRRAQPIGNNGGQRGAENGTADGPLHETETRNGTANGLLLEYRVRKLSE